MEVPNFPNYICYPDGRVYNKKFNRKMKHYKDKRGYIVLSVYKEGKKYVIKLHRILAELYIENPNNLPVVDHYDGKRDNNCLSNLRWVSRSENSRNQKKPRNNTSGHMGVRIEQKKCGTRYRATWTLTFDKDLGKKQKTQSKTFHTLEEAVEHRRRMNQIYNPSLNMERHNY